MVGVETLDRERATEVVRSENGIDGGCQHQRRRRHRAAEMGVTDTFIASRGVGEATIFLGLGGKGVREVRKRMKGGPLLTKQEKYCK